MKQCRLCGERRELEHFHKHATTADGLQTWCIDCKRLERRNRLAITVRPDRPQSKVCKYCQVTRDTCKFEPRIDSKDGYSARCNHCRNKDDRARRAKLVQPHK